MTAAERELLLFLAELAKTASYHDQYIGLKEYADIVGQINKLSERVKLEAASEADGIMTK